MNSNHCNLLMLMTSMVVHMIFASTTPQIYMMGLWNELHKKIEESSSHASIDNCFSYSSFGPIILLV